MSGIASAALILSLALVVLPGSPRCRLTPDDTGRRVLLVGARRVAWGVGCVAVGVAALLPLPTVVAVAVLGATLGLRYRRRRRYLRRSREGQALEAALELVVGELRAGAHPVRAFSIAADETGGPVAVALRAVAARARLGADVTAGLLAAARSSALPAYWERLAVCWQLGSDHGLAIASLMRAAQRDVAERQRFSARVSAGMAGARASAAILAILPLLGVLLGQLIGARPLSFLLTGRVGGWLLVVGLTLAAPGCCGRTGSPIGQCCECGGGVAGHGVVARCRPVGGTGASREAAPRASATPGAAATADGCRGPASRRSQP